VLQLPQVPAIGVVELIYLVQSVGLRCRGIGWTDAAIVLACANARPPAALRTRDRRMVAAAAAIGVQVLDAA